MSEIIVVIGQSLLDAALEKRVFHEQKKIQGSIGVHPLAIPYTVELQFTVNEISCIIEDDLLQLFANVEVRSLQISLFQIKRRIAIMVTTTLENGELVIRIKSLVVPTIEFNIPWFGKIKLPNIDVMSNVTHPVEFRIPVLKDYSFGLPDEQVLTLVPCNPSFKLLSGRIEVRAEINVNAAET